MAQTVQLLGTLVHRPRLIVLDEPFSGLDALNQGRLEALIRAQAADGVTVLFSTHVIAHAERLCERIAIIAGGRVRFEGAVEEARDRLRPQVRLGTRAGRRRVARGAARRRAARATAIWRFALPDDGVEPLLKALIEGGAGIETLSIERPGLHDAFVAIAGAAAARDMDAPTRGGARHEPAVARRLRHRPARLCRERLVADLPAVPDRAAAADRRRAVLRHGRLGHRPAGDPPARRGDRRGRGGAG